MSAPVDKNRQATHEDVKEYFLEIHRELDDYLGDMPEEAKVFCKTLWEMLEWDAADLPTIAELEKWEALEYYKRLRGRDQFEQ